MMFVPSARPCGFRAYLAGLAAASGPTFRAGLPPA